MNRAEALELALRTATPGEPYVCILERAVSYQQFARLPTAPKPFVATDRADFVPAEIVARAMTKLTDLRAEAQAAGSELRAKRESLPMLDVTQRVTGDVDLDMLVIKYERAVAALEAATSRN